MVSLLYCVVALCVAAAKTDPLQKLHAGFCQALSLDPAKVKLLFDGEEVDLNSTPQDEDMDDEDSLDAVVLE
jgi:hypothetical protein